MFAPPGSHAPLGEKNLMKCTLVAACALLAALSAPSFAQTLSLALVSPANSVVTISASISGAPSNGVGGGTFVIQYNTTQLRPSSVNEGAYLTGEGVTPANFNVTVPAAGSLMVMFSGGSTSAAGGSGDLADFSFSPTYTSFGVTTISISSASGFTTPSNVAFTVGRGGPVPVAIPMPAAVPEPGAGGMTLSALGSGLLMLGMRRKAKSSRPAGR